APRLATGLDRAGARIGAAHERHRPARVAALGELLLRRAELREVDPRARAAAEDDPLAPDPVEDRLHRAVDRGVEAGAAPARRLEADVEPARRVEGRVLVHQDRLELGLEGLGLRLVGEIAALAAPGADRVDDAADHLLHALLALRARHAAAEVLLRDDVGRGLRPELRELDALLLEDGALLAGDQGVARLPFDLLERVAAGDGEQALDSDLCAVFDDGVLQLFSGCIDGLQLLL